MRTVNVALNEDLLRSADQAAKRIGVSRSALIRQALAAHLKSLEMREELRKDQEGYEKYPDTEPDRMGWEQVTSWPDE
jgi:metal-responsive CopG/Arc/MetJ family transcriptional regulator